MMIIAVLFVFLFGLAIGSFLNVVIYRFNTGRGLGGRSGCMNCGKTLEWYELFPVVSFLVQRARCRKCSSKLSWQYPAVEFLTGILFASTFVKYISEPHEWHVLFSFILMLIVWSLLVVIVVYDFRHKIIPDSLVYTFAALGLLRIFVTVPHSPAYIFYGTLLAGPALFLPFFILWFISGGRWIGLGDGKLALGIGWMLGLGYGLSAIVLGFWVGALFSVVYMLITHLKLKGKNITMKSEIPFAPYLILGFAIVYFLSIDVMGLYSIFKI